VPARTGRQWPEGMSHRCFDEASPKTSIIRSGRSRCMPSDRPATTRHSNDAGRLGRRRVTTTPISAISAGCEDS
jgi:hypothetical protein